jgi:hypothetical protein
MIERKTVFSPCRCWRYSLWREFTPAHPSIYSPSDYVSFCCLNPSTADEIENDNTISRCIGFAKDWGFSAMCMTNIFAWRDTMPANMKKAAEPIGSENDRILIEILSKAKLVVAAWGTHGSFLNRSAKVRIMLRNAGIELKCFGTGVDKEPFHPLYQPKTRPLVPYIGK